MKNYKFSSALLILVVSGIIGAAAVYNDEGGFTDDFSDQTLPGWENSGTAIVKDGILILESGAAVLKPGSWSDFQLTLKVRLSGQGNFIIEYHSSEDESHQLDITAENITVKHRIGEEAAPMGQTEKGATSSSWIEISILTEDNNHRVSVDGVELLSVKENEPSFSGGILMKAVQGIRAEIDEISLTLIGANQEPLKPSGDTSVDRNPAYMSEPWKRMGGPPGGLGYDIRMRPDNPDIMFVTDANAGIHKSVDGGLTWEAKNEGIHLFLTGGAPVFCATIDPHDYDTVWIGMQGLGHVFMSDNNGETWEQRDNGIEYEGRSIRGITIDPNNPDVVYVGLEVSSYVWNGEPISKRFDLTQGEVYKSTDRGMTWQRIWVGDNLARYVWVDPRDSNKLFISTGIFDRDAANSDVPNGDWGGVGIVRSKDGGLTWTVLDEKNGLGGRYIPSLFMHPENPDILLAGVTNTSDQPGSFVTYDGGDSWKLVLATPPGFGVEAVEISESDPNVWYVAAEGMIWRSDDAGREWEKYEVGINGRRSGMPIDLQVDPRDPMRIFINNYGGGNFLSEDGGKTWMDASQGYTGIGDLQNIRVFPGNNRLIFVRDFVSTDGGETWQSNRFDIAGSVVVSRKNEGEFFIASDSSGNVRRSTDGGKSWTEPIRVVDIQAGLKNGSLDLEAYPMVALANSNDDPEMIYAGFTQTNCLARLWYKCLYRTPGFYRSINGGSDWEKIEIPPGDISILGIAVDTQDSRHLFIGTADGLYESLDGGLNWVRNKALDNLTGSISIHPELAQNGMQPSMILDVVYDPLDFNVIYVSSTPGGVYRSQDGGATWKHIAAGMDPNEIVYTLLPDPKREGVMYASTAFSGVFVTENRGDKWRNINKGLTFTNVRGISLSADGSVLYAGAEGGGVFRLGNPFQ